MKFKAKPITIEATRWLGHGDHPGVVPLHWWLREGDVCSYCTKQVSEHGRIRGVDGDQVVCSGDWIVTDVDGNYYAMNPAAFHTKYRCIEKEVDMSINIAPDDIRDKAIAVIEAITGDDFCTSAEIALSMKLPISQADAEVMVHKLMTIYTYAHVAKHPICIESHKNWIAKLNKAREELHEQ